MIHGHNTKLIFAVGFFKYHTHTQLQINISVPPHSRSNVGISHRSVVDVTATFITRCF